MRYLISDTVSDIPRRWSSIEPSEPIFIPDDRLKVTLLGIALDDLAKTQAKPLRRSQLARRDYVPEAALPEEKKRRFEWFGNLVDRSVAVIELVRPAVIPVGILVLALSAMKAGSDWINKESVAGVFKTHVHVHVQTIGDVQDERLPDGRVVRTLYKGKVPSVSQLPPVTESQMGDMWFTEKDGTFWVVTTLNPTSWVVGWVDP